MEEEEKMEEVEKSILDSDNHFSRVIKRIADHQQIGTFEELIPLYDKFKPLINHEYLRRIEKVVNLRKDRAQKPKKNFSSNGGGGGGAMSFDSKLGSKNMYASARTSVSRRRCIYIRS